MCHTRPSPIVRSEAKLCAPVFDLTENLPARLHWSNWVDFERCSYFHLSHLSRIMVLFTSSFIPLMKNPPIHSLRADRIYPY
jgi:hypothetical protein